MERVAIRLRGVPGACDVKGLSFAKRVMGKLPFAKCVHSVCQACDDRSWRV